MISIIVSWNNRSQLASTVNSFVTVARDLNAELVLVNFGGEAGQLDVLMGDCRPTFKIIMVHSPGLFNKSASQNIGAYCASKKVFFFCDCDIILDTPTIASLYELVGRQDGRFATVAGVRETEINSRNAQHVISFGYTLHIKTADGRELHIIDNEENAQDGTRQAPGLLMVRQDAFVRIGGYNSRLHGWGWEDQDIISRLTLGLGLERIQAGTLQHVSHDDHDRLKNYPHIVSRWTSRDHMFRAALSNYDNADFQGTYEADTKQYRYEVV